MEDLKPSRPSSWARFVAYASGPVSLVMMSDLFFSGMDASVQLLELRGLPIPQVILMRMTSNAIACFIFLYIRHRQSLHSLLQRSSYLIWIRAVFAALSSAASYAAVSQLPLSIFMVLYHLRSFTTALACYLLLGERSSRIQIMAAVISFLAVILVVQPDFIFHRHREAGDITSWSMFLGVASTMVSMLFGALDIVICRKLGDSISSVTMLFSFSIVGCTIGSVGSIFTGWEPIKTPSTSLLIANVCVLGLLAQCTMVLGLQVASGMRVALLGYFQIFWAVGFQIVLYALIPNWIQILGTAIIVAAGIWAIVKGNPEAEESGEKADEEVHVPLVATPRTPMTGRERYEPVPLAESEDDMPIGTTAAGRPGV